MIVWFYVICIYHYVRENPSLASELFAPNIAVGEITSLGLYSSTLCCEPLSYATPDVVIPHSGECCRSLHNGLAIQNVRRFPPPLRYRSRLAATIRNTLEEEITFRNNIDDKTIHYDTYLYKIISLINIVRSDKCEPGG